MIKSVSTTIGPLATSTASEHLQPPSASTNGTSAEKSKINQTKKPTRATWDNKTQFLMACISFAVGLGNIWRFPALVYEHNGGAFLIPYFACSFIIGFPMLYLELSLGQFARVGPAVLYGRIRPLLHGKMLILGIGWAMVGMTLMVSIYYNMLVAWIVIFIVKVVIGDSYQWSSCENWFNTQYCMSTLEDDRCSLEMSEAHGNGTTTASGGFYFNGSCYSSTDVEMKRYMDAFFHQYAAISPAEEFFENYVLEKTPTVDTLGGLNLKVVAAYFVAWLTTALILFRGVKVIGRVATITATVPYFIIAVLFVRSVTLEGAYTGLRFYLLEPDFSTIWDFAAWRAAATHVSYSLSVGFGGIIALASYNPPEQNCFRDAAIITLADAFMSLFAGTSVFCVLGFMANRLNVPIDEVVQSGTGLAFIAYPEALSRMPVTWLWALLFFLMLWILGISSQFGYGECMCTALADQFPVLRRNRAKMVFALCGVLYLMGLLLATRAGIYYFNIFNDYSSSFSLTFVLGLESVLICYIYGYKNYIADLRTMFGEPASRVAALLGPTGSCIAFAWRFLCPVQATIIFMFSLLTQITYDLTYGKGKRLYVLPRWCIAFGWALSIFPLLFFPIFAAYNAYTFRRDNLSIAELFRVQPKWPSYKRVSAEQSHSTNRFVRYWRSGGRVVDAPSAVIAAESSCSTMVERDLFVEVFGGDGGDSTRPDRILPAATLLDGANNCEIDLTRRPTANGNGVAAITTTTTVGQQTRV